MLICALYGAGYRRPGTSLVAKASGSVVVSLARCDVGQPSVINWRHASALSFTLRKIWCSTLNRLGVSVWCCCGFFFFFFFTSAFPVNALVGYVCVSEYMRELEGELELQIIMLPSYSQSARRKQHLQPRASHKVDVIVASLCWHVLAHFPTRPFLPRHIGRHFSFPLSLSLLTLFNAQALLSAPSIFATSLLSNSVQHTTMTQSFWIFFWLVQFSSRWYRCAQESPCALHPVSEKFPQRCLWNSSSV